MKRIEHKILKSNDYTGSYQIPLFLDSSVDEMGVMVSFDGDMEQIEQLCNFTYKQSGSTITIYNSVNPDKLRKITEQTFTINWGDGTTSGLTVNSGIVGSNLPSVVKTYTGSTQYTITISSSTPWSTEVLKKTITVPSQYETIDNPFGYFTGYTLANGSVPTYLHGYEYQTGSIAITTGKTFTFMAMGKSRLGEFRQYGTSSFSTGVEILPTYTGYTINGLYYMDYPDGYTKITGSVPNYVYDLKDDLTGYTYNSTGGTETYKFNLGSGSNFTPEYLDDRDITNYIINHRLTRNEHFLGFIDDPQVYSDIFVERGKQGVMENNLRLGEIDNMDELEIYGNGYFKVRKQ